MTVACYYQNVLIERKNIEMYKETKRERERMKIMTRYRGRSERMSQQIAIRRDPTSFFQVHWPKITLVIGSSTNPISNVVLSPLPSFSLSISQGLYISMHVCRGHQAVGVVVRSVEGERIVAPRAATKYSTSKLNRLSDEYLNVTKCQGEIPLLFTENCCLSTKRPSLMLQSTRYSLTYLNRLSEC